MSIQQLTAMFTAAFVLVLATGCGVEGEENAIAVHRIQLENGDETPTFECIALAREMAYVPNTPMVPLTVHPEVGLKAHRITAARSCVKTPIELHPSIRGAQEIAIVPQSNVTAPIEIHEDIVEPTEVVWMVDTENGAHLLPAMLSHEVDAIIVLVPQLADFPVYGEQTPAVIDIVEIEQFSPGAGLFEVNAPLAVDGDFTNADDDEDDDEDDDDDA